MFLQYAVPGAWVPLFSLRLADLSFSQVQIGWAGATYALAALATPFLARPVRARRFPPPARPRPPARRRRLPPVAARGPPRPRRVLLALPGRLAGLGPRRYPVRLHLLHPPARTRTDVRLGADVGD